MQAGISPSQFHETLLRELFPYSPHDNEVLCAMIILHTCNLRLSSEARIEGAVTGFEGLAAMAAAEVVAVLFEKPNDLRNTPEYWYRRWTHDWKGYNLIESIPVELKAELQRVHEQFVGHPWIERLDDEGWDVLS